MDVNAIMKMAKLEQNIGLCCDPAKCQAPTRPQVPLYHGCSVESAEVMLKGGTNWKIYLTDSEDVAEFFARRASHGCGNGRVGVGVILRVDADPRLVEMDLYYAKMWAQWKEKGDRWILFNFTPTIFNIFYGHCWTTEQPIAAASIARHRNVMHPSPSPDKNAYRE